jgi:DNA-binding transcriptional regulator GbsR (MarR family)
VSTSLKELQSWRLAHVTHVMGDRRDHFEVRKDVWEMVTTIVEERKKREVDPTLTVLRQCVLEASEDRKTPTEVKDRIEGMLEFLELASNWHNELKQMPRPIVVKLMKLGGKIAKFIGGS